jgi:hypothetical protein
MNCSLGNGYSSPPWSQSICLTMKISISTLRTNSLWLGPKCSSLLLMSSKFIQSATTNKNMSSNTGNILVGLWRYLSVTPALSMEARSLLLRNSKIHANFYPKSKSSSPITTQKSLTFSMIAVITSIKETADSSIWETSFYS